jgi:hypothetical protein
MSTTSLLNPARKISVTFLFALAAVTGACSDAGVTGPVAPEQPALAKATSPARAPWTAAGPGAVALVADGTTGDAVMSYEMHGSGVWSPQTWAFTTTAAQAGTVSLPWSYTGFHSFFQVRVRLYAVVNNTVVGTLVNDGPVNCCSQPSGGFSYHGTHTFTVQPGDTYGFRFGGQNFDSNDVLSGRFTVDLPENPTTKDDCKDGGWVAYGFRNQGQCVRFVETGYDDR